jgi:hypothetical protein
MKKLQPRAAPITGENSDFLLRRKGWAQNGKKKR